MRCLHNTRFMWRARGMRAALRYLLAVTLFAFGSANAGDWRVQVGVVVAASSIPIIGKMASGDSAPATIALGTFGGKPVFAGDSITGGWSRAQAARNVGLSGQPTAVIGARFAEEIKQGKPAYAHILAGTNDFILAGPTGPDRQAMLASMDNMLNAARAARVPVIVGTVLPMDLTLRPTGATIPDYNAALVARVGRRAVIADYYGAMVGSDGKINNALFRDGVHPNAAGYAVMDGVFTSALSELQRRQQRREERRAAWQAKTPEQRAQARAAWKEKRAGRGAQ